ncbi:Ig-like domain-containing protein [Microbacterium sp. CFBP 13617]|uniref:RCC1 domain-containing protein n=1 Tax=Microbacterium sp. CFBP 13617 TaxID=2774035 RepID=UPI00178702D2|nr:Ig-like domain-containing protein [Microbacterium sp. CFBP 13617]MBD8219070.1 Ig-like domain-containing protein [Microbacterium sp. CFBP 13617]
MNITPSDSVAPVTASGPSRRVLLGGAAWSVPAIVVMTTAPAYAAGSELGTLGVTTPNMQVVAAGTTAVTALLRDTANQPLAGRAVTFTGPAGSSFSPATATTNGSGIATTTLTTTDTWATPGSSLTLTATSTGITGTATLSVLGANAYATGNNANSALGTGSSATAISTPAQLSLVFPSPVKSLTGAPGFSLALLEDGTVWSIGDNSLGQLGDGTTTTRTTWAKIPSLSGVTQIAVAGSRSGYALLSTGQVRAWGSNVNGELGNGTTTNSTTPVAVSTLTDATQIAAGTSTAYAMVAGGQVRAWGLNDQGQLGNGTTTNSTTPVTVQNITGATQIAAGAFSGFALVGGTVRAWGSNAVGTLGNGTNTSSSIPVTVQNITGATQIAAGLSTGYALVGGQVRAWGNSGNGALGNGTGSSTNTPVTVCQLTGTNQLDPLTGITQIDAGNFSGYAVNNTGTVYAWGNNAQGELGIGSTPSTTNTAVTVPGIGGTPTIGKARIKGGARMFFLRTGSDTLSVTTSNMQVVAAGTTVVTAVLRDSANQPLVGKAVTFTGPAGSSFSPATATTNGSGIAITTLTTTDTWATPGSSLQLTAASTGVTGTATLTVLGANAYATGNNDNSSLGTGSSATTISTPAQLSLVFPSPVKSLTAASGFSLALLHDGTVWSIGDNSLGQLGDGTTTTRTTWAKIPSLSGVTQIAATASRSGYALLSNGQVRAWGSNVNGELGNGTTTNSTTPVTVSTLTDATQIAAGSGSAYAIVAGGQMRAWGLNDRNQLGNGSSTNSTTPVAVQNITGATQIAAGSFSGFALVGGGAIRAWGSNAVGALGNGTNTSSSVPVTVQNITGATQIAAGLSTGYALVGGQVRAWGYNANGGLGNGTNTDSNTPVTVYQRTGINQLDPLTGITQIDAGYFSGYAVNNTGTVYAWGNNPQGELGIGNTTNTNTAVTVQGLGGTPTIGQARNRGGAKMFFIR